MSSMFREYKHGEAVATCHCGGEHTDSIDTAYSRGRRDVRNVKKVASTGSSLRKRVTTWLSNRRHIACGIDCPTIIIKYNIQSGVQGQEHPNPGQRYKDILQKSLPPIRRGLKHYDSSGLPGTIDVYSKSEQALQRERKRCLLGNYTDKTVPNTDPNEFVEFGFPTITTGKS